MKHIKFTISLFLVLICSQNGFASTNFVHPPTSEGTQMVCEGFWYEESKKVEVKTTITRNYTNNLSATLDAKWGPNQRFE